MKKLCCLAMLCGVLSMVLAPQLCYGNGFAIYEGSARGNALGGTLVGRADDPSALYYNPAGITQLPGLQMMMGATAITPSADVVTQFQGTRSSTTTEDNWYLPPHFYTSYQVSDAVWLGLGVFSPFGLGVEFNENWPGRYNSYNAELQTVSVNPNLAVKITDKLSLAAGLSAMWLNLKLEKKIDPYGQNNPNVSTYDVDSTLEGDSVGIGFNVAAHYKAFDWLALGASYRSQVKQNVSNADADFTKPSQTPPLPPPLNQLYPSWFNDTNASGTVTLPDMLSLGAVFRPLERLSVEVDGLWTRWSSYDELSFTFSQPIAIDRQTGGPLRTVTTPKDWHDVWRIQVGAEYKVTDWFDFRLGYIWDESPVPDATVDYILPTDNRNLYSIGGGFHWQNWTVDVSYTYLTNEDRTVAARPAQGILESEFKSVDANLIGLSLSYKF
jgi:long-chain fatty acid transport protein